MNVVSSIPQIVGGYRSYVQKSEDDPEPVEQFLSECEKLRKQVLNIEQVPIEISEMQELQFKVATNCYICDGSFSEKDVKVSQIFAGVFL